MRFVLSSFLSAATLAAMASPAAAAAPDSDKEIIPKPEDEPWGRRWRPRRNMWELGVYGGLLRLNPRHELFAPRRAKPNGGWLPLRVNNPELGLRLGYYPASFLGLEAEGSMMLGKLDDSQPEVPTANALLYSGRGHLLFQIPAGNLVPFVLGGVGVLGIKTAPEAVGADADFAAHFGGGLKFFVSKRAMLRLDARDVLTMMVNNPINGEAQILRSHNLEVLFGLSLALNRPEPTPPPPPEPPKDTDGDGISDNRDECPTEAETFNEFQDKDGCPESDRDNDGFWDRPEQDECPDEAGVEPDGCPIRDSDGDGILDPDDKCPEEAETKNGFEDDDGCPDEVPKEVERFMGVIDGIHFDTGKDTIRADSRVVLQRAIDILNKYPSVRIEISGHTDNRGSRSFNLDLSQRRADAVKNFLSSQSVDPTRIETRGVAFDEPRAENVTREGRALNRRIEFKILSQ